MRQLRVALVSTLTLTGVAHADVVEPLDTRESALLYDATPLRSDEVGFAWRAEALAAALATTGNGSTGGLASASGEFAVTGAGDCDAVTAGGQLAGRSDDRTVSAQQWASVCPLGGDGFIRVDHLLEWDVQPRLLAAPRFRAGHQRRESIALDFFGSQRNVRGDLSLVEPRDWWQGGQFRLELQFGWLDTTGMTEVRALFDIVLMHWLHKQAGGSIFKLAIFAPRLDALFVEDLPGDPGMGTLAVDLGRIENVELGPFHIGGRLGGRVGGISVGREETFRTTFVTVGEGGIYIERELADRVTTRLAGDRLSFPTYTGGLAIDDRATWSLTAERGRFRGKLELAAASTHLINVAKRKDIANGGVTVEAEYDLGHHVALAARSEAGKSVYAKSATLDEPRWASETQLVLATRAGSRYKR